MILASIIIRFIIVKRSRGKLYTLDSFTGKNSLGVVLGARVLAGNRPSRMLEDRLQTAAEGFRRGLFQKILITGKSRENQNEIKVMADYLLEQGIPGKSIIQDGGSQTTKRSFQRLNLFHADPHCILITQRFHLPRSLFLAEVYGFKPVGLIADRQRYRKYFPMIVREFGATVKDVVFSGRALKDSVV